MDKFKRRLLFLFFFLLFLITVPLVVLFVQGYRFDRINGIFVYSGSIAIKSWPKDIEVFLDGKKYSKKRSGLINDIFILSGIRPGKHHLSCRKEGYSSWEKNIEIHSGISTEFWNVLLFPKKENLIINNHPITKKTQRFFISPRDNEELIFTKQENNQSKIMLLNIKTNQAEEIFSVMDWNLPTLEDKENIEWSTDNESLLIPMYNNEKQKEYFIGKIKKNQLEKTLRLSEIFFPLKNTPLKKINQEKNESTDSFRKVRWMFDKNDELVILTTNQKLFYLNIQKPEEKILLAENVSDFDFAGNRIYYSQNPNNLVWEIKDNDITTRRQITKTAFLSEKENDFINLKVYDEYRISMINNLGNLFIFNQEKEKNEIVIEEFQGDFIDSQFTDNGKKILYWSNHEIWVFYLREWDIQPIRLKNEKNLIARFSQPLKNVQWMESYENILFTSGNQLKSAEIDTRNKINIVDVLEKENPWNENEVIYDKDSQMLFYLNEIPNEGKIINSFLLFNKKTFLNF